MLTFEVTSTRAGYTTVVKTSPGKTIVGLAQTLTPTPLITGTAKVANTLTGDPGTWDVDTALAYQWFADGTAIGGATGLTYDLTPGRARQGDHVRGHQHQGHLRDGHQDQQPDRRRRRR